MKLNKNKETLLLAIYVILGVASIIYAMVYHLVLKEIVARTYNIIPRFIYLLAVRPILYYLIGAVLIIILFKFGNLKAENIKTIKTLSLIALIVLTAYILSVIFSFANFINVRFISNISRIYTSYPIIFTISGLFLTLRFYVEYKGE